MSTSFFDALGTELGGFLAPAVEAVEDPYLLSLLLKALGSAPDDPGAALFVSTLQDVANVIHDVETIAANPSPSLANIHDLLESSRRAILALQSLDASGQATAALGGIGKDLIDLLVGIYVAGKFPLLYRIAVLLSVIDSPEDVVPTQPALVNGKVVRKSVKLPRFHPDRLIALIQDPVALLKAEYLNSLATDANANEMADKLFPRVRGVFRALNLLCNYGVTPECLPLLGDGAPYVDHALTVWVAEEVLGASADAGLSFALSPASRGDLGFVISPFGALQFTDQIGTWTVEFDFTATVEALAIGRRGAVVAASEQTTSVDGKVSATLASPDDGPAFILGSPTGTRLEVGGAKLLSELSVKEATFGWSMSADVSSSKLVLSPGDGDGFLTKVLPADGLSTQFGLGIAWSNTGGLAFRGASSLAAALPISVSLGGIRASTLYVTIEADNHKGVSAEASFAVDVTLGPISAVIDRVGLLANASFPASGGNLGVAEFVFTFKPPSGLGVSVDAATVSGGGFLEHKGDEYSGALDLAVTDIAVKAFGSLQTKLPGNVPGYSFIIALSVEFRPSIQLPFGFSLDGVGGIVGINRTVAVDVVQAALWAHHLDGLLFPKDLIASAPQLIVALDSYFPPANGRYLIGPMAKIGWGDGIVEGEIALLIELPEPLRLLLLGEIEVGVPMEQPQLELHISFDGGIDFGKKLAFFDATLHDSRIESFPISGDLAFRDGWSDDGSVALALGGFNPHFQPPAAFPTLKRLAITIGSSVAQIEAQAYIALTANTLQFGARVEMTAVTGIFNVHGWLGIDALCERHPMSFTFDLSGGIDLRHGTDVLASVHLDGHLAGPTPWHISGDASLSLFLFDVTVRFDKTWGHSADTLSLPDPLSLVLSAFANESSFRSVLPAGVRTSVSLAEAPTDANHALLLEPACSLRIAQRVLPFGQPMTRFGGAPLGRTVQLMMDGVTAFTTTFQQPPTATEEFAPAQYFEFSDADKLSLPSFCRFDAGVEIAGDAIDIGSSERRRAVVTQFSYDTTIFDSVSKRPGDYTLGAVALLAMNGRAMAPRVGLSRYAPLAGTPSRVSLAPDRWVIAGTNDLTLRPDISTDGSKLGAQLALKNFLAANADQRGRLQVVLFEEAA
jgi:hypothetical protein